MFICLKSIGFIGDWVDRFVFDAVTSMKNVALTSIILVYHAITCDVFANNCKSTLSTSRQL